MKVSVLIIAHNEEKNIHESLSGILKQTKHPDEIIVICHNCTDNTAQIARHFKEVTVIEDASPPGAVYARIRGFKEVLGDIICCLDGDTRIEKNWLEEIVWPFKNKEVVAVGTDVRVHGTILDYLGSLNYFHGIPFLVRFAKEKHPLFFWGASFAIRKSAYDTMDGFNSFLDLREKLGLELMPDDWYLGIRLAKTGTLVTTRKTTAHAISKCKNSWERLLQNRKQVRDGKKLYAHFNM